VKGAQLAAHDYKEANKSPSTPNMVDLTGKHMKTYENKHT
jgi:hypothetical protein